MTRRAAFNADEWAVVTEAPALAAMAVIAADRGGTLRESLSLGRAYAAARREQPVELLEELLSAPPTVSPEQVANRDELEARATDRLRQALAILEAKATPEEVGAYRRFVLDIAEAVARAHKEGGFLGIGGKEISEGEQAALDRIAETLGQRAA